ncbi:MAG: GNAT family N-acetyltransferase [Oscillospiraceae bacterium]
MDIKPASPQQMAWAYENHMKPSFPAAELAPLQALQKLYDEGRYRPWCLFDGETIVGEAFVYACEPGFGLLEYLCVAPEARCGGLGSKLLAAVCEAEEGSILFGEAEIPAYAEDEVVAKRRIGFYLRSGAQIADYDTCLFGVPYHTLYWAKNPPETAALCAAHERAYRRRFSAQAFQKFVRIPWDASMGRMEQVTWNE